MNSSRAASLTHDPGSPSGALPAARVMRLTQDMTRLLSSVTAA
jgi:hypothetical protein